MIDKMSNASRLVEKLRLKGYIERTVCSFDKRQVDICITKQGKVLLEKVNNEVNAIINEHNHVPTKDLEALNQTLDQFRKG